MTDMYGKTYYIARQSRDLPGWFFVRKMPGDYFIPRLANPEKKEDKYYKTHFAVTEAVAVLNLQLEIEKKLRTMTDGAAQNG